MVDVADSYKSRLEASCSARFGPQLLWSCLSLQCVAHIGLVSDLFDLQVRLFTVLFWRPCVFILPSSLPSSSLPLGLCACASNRELLVKSCHLGGADFFAAQFGQPIGRLAYEKAGNSICDWVQRKYAFVHLSLHGPFSVVHFFKLFHFAERKQHGML